MFLNPILTLSDGDGDGDMGEGRSLAWNPASGQHGIPLSLAFCGSRSKVRVWDIISPSISQARFEGHMYSPTSCAWSPCGQLLAATWIQDDLTTIFKNQEDQAEGMGLLSFYGPREFREVNKMIRVCWSASGSLLATCGGKDNSISIWKINIANIAFGPPVTVICTYKPIKHRKWALRILGNRVLTGAWRVEPDDELEFVAYLREHAGDVNYVQWHPKRDVLFSCSSDHTIKVWIGQERDGCNNWQCVQTLGQSQFGHDTAVWSLAFNTSGDKMVTSSDDGNLTIWEVMEPSSDTFLLWNHVYTLIRCHDGAIFSVHWSSEGIIATGGADGMIGLFGEVTGSPNGVTGPLYQLLSKEKKHDQRINSVQWSPGEDRVLASTGSDETIKLWKLEQANEEQANEVVESNF